MKFPQLSLRDLFWLVLVCAMGLGWWMDQARIHQMETELKDRREIMEAESRNRSEQMDAELSKRIRRAKRREKLSDEVFEYLWENYPDQREKLEGGLADKFLEDSPLFPLF